MQGQTIKRFESEGWWQALTQGKVIRTYAVVPLNYGGVLDIEDLKQGFAIKRVGKAYMMFDEGIGNAIQFDYVNGYSYGADMTFGTVCSQGGRLEVSPELRYSDRRHKWSGALEFRYFLPPAYYSWVELYYRNKCIDFDNYAYSTIANNSAASAIAGWNGYKLYEAQQIGFKGSMVVASDLQLEGGAWHEQRQRVENHRQRNMFRVRGEDNTPRLRGVELDNPIHQWEQQKLWRIDAALEYTCNRRIMCYNDMRTEALPGNPVFRLGVQSGWGDIDYMALDLSVKQTLGDDRQGFRYYVDAGYYPLGKHRVGVIDMHHFDASHLVLQRTDNLTWFSLLSNYELSSSNEWCEAHIEWNSCKLLLTQLTNDPSLKEYLQLHYASVQGYRQHTELSYGIDLAEQMRIGCSFGWDGSNFDGIGLNIVFYNPVLGKN